MILRLLSMVGIVSSLALAVSGCAAVQNSLHTVGDAVCSNPVAVSQGLDLAAAQAETIKDEGKRTAAVAAIAAARAALAQCPLGVAVVPVGSGSNGETPVSNAPT